VVAVAIVETCLAHAALLVPRTTASSRRAQMAILRRSTSRLGLLSDLARRGSFSALGTVSSVVVDAETGEDIIRVKTFLVQCRSDMPAITVGVSATHCSRIAFTEWPHENQTLTKFRG
jgi:hypothetical protein